MKPLQSWLHVLAVSGWVVAAYLMISNSRFQHCESTGSTPNGVMSNLEEALALDWWVDWLSYCTTLWNPLTLHERRIISTFERVSPSVVGVQAVFVDKVPLQRFQLNGKVGVGPGTRKRGTGFIWDRNGHIVTSSHVVLGEDRSLPIRLHIGMEGGIVFDAIVVGADPENDIAVLRLNSYSSESLPAPVGVEASSNARVGQTVLAIGNPMRNEPSLTVGIIRSLQVEAVETQQGEKCSVVEIHTDAAIFPGSSGGPLLNTVGQLVGMVKGEFETTDRAIAGLGIAIPSCTVVSIVNRILSSRES